MQSLESLSYQDLEKRTTEIKTLLKRNEVALKKLTDSLTEKGNNRDSFSRLYNVLDNNLKTIVKTAPVISLPEVRIVMGLISRAYKGMIKFTEEAVAIQKKIDGTKLLIADINEALVILNKEWAKRGKLIELKKP